MDDHNTRCLQHYIFPGSNGCVIEGIKIYKQHLLKNPKRTDHSICRCQYILLLDVPCFQESATSADGTYGIYFWCISFFFRWLVCQQLLQN